MVNIQKMVNLYILTFYVSHQLGHLTLEDYQIWSVNSALANEFLNLLFQVSTPEIKVLLKLKCNVLYVHVYFTPSRSATSSLASGLELLRRRDRSSGTYPSISDIAALSSADFTLVFWCVGAG